MFPPYVDTKDTRFVVRTSKKVTLIPSPRIVSIPDTLGGHRITAGVQPIIEALEVSAHGDDHRIFTEQIEAIDWSVRQPEELIQVIHLTLSLDLPSLAIKLAQRGRQLFPDHEHIQHVARVLTPPTIRVSQSPPTTGLKASREWLRNHAGQYRGQWVAVQEGQLLGTGRSPNELLAIIGPDQDLSSIIMTEVL